jgi:H+/Cl- antiporter ClcA
MPRHASRSLVIRLGALLATLAGRVTIGFTVAHLLPLSTDSYWDLQPSLVSWLFALLPAALGLAVAVLAWSQWRAAIRSPTTPRSAGAWPRGRVA